MWTNKRIKEKLVSIYESKINELKGQIDTADEDKRIAYQEEVDALNNELIEITGNGSL